MANQGNVAEAAANKPLQCLYCDVKFTSLIDVLRHNSSAQHNARMQEVNGCGTPATPIEQKKGTISEADRMCISLAESEFKCNFFTCPVDKNFHEFLVSQNIFQPSQPKNVPASSEKD